MPFMMSLSLPLPVLSRIFTDTMVAAGAVPIADVLTPRAPATPATSVPWPSSSIA